MLVGRDCGWFVFVFFSVLFFCEERNKVRAICNNKKMIMKKKSGVFLSFQVFDQTVADDADTEREGGREKEGKERKRGG